MKCITIMYLGHGCDNSPHLREFRPRNFARKGEGIDFSYLPLVPRWLPHSYGVYIRPSPRVQFCSSTLCSL